MGIGNGFHLLICHLCFIICGEKKKPIVLIRAKCRAGESVDTDRSREISRGSGLCAPCALARCSFTPHAPVPLVYIKCL